MTVAPPARPLLGGSDEGVVQRFLGGVEAAEQADQRRENATTFLPVERGQSSVHATDQWTSATWHSQIFTAASTWADAASPSFPP